MNKLILASLLALGTWVCWTEKSSAQYVTYYAPGSSYVYYSGPTTTVWPTYTYYSGGRYVYPPPYQYPSYPVYSSPSYYYRSGLLGRRAYYYGPRYYYP
jgi:hypothetical protein